LRLPERAAAMMRSSMLMPAASFSKRRLSNTRGDIASRCDRVLPSGLRGASISLVALRAASRIVTLACLWRLLQHH